MRHILISHVNNGVAMQTSHRIDDDPTVAGNYKVALPERAYAPVEFSIELSNGYDSCGVKQDSQTAQNSFIRVIHG